LAERLDAAAGDDTRFMQGDSSVNLLAPHRSMEQDDVMAWIVEQIGRFDNHEREWLRRDEVRQTRSEKM